MKDVLAFLRILENPRDEVSWYRILLLLPGIGDATARSAIESMAGAAWASAAFGRYSPPPRARGAHQALVALLDELRSGASDDAKVAADIARVRMLYDSILREKYDRAEPRIADLDQLQVIAAGYPDRATFLSALALEPPQATQDLPGASSKEDEDCLVLSTAHSSKGKEWEAVFVIWAVDGWFPSARCLNSEEETDEERRLMYVAMTRAKNYLSVTYPLNAYSTRRGAEYTLDQLSRFIDRGVREKMERLAVGAQEVKKVIEVPQSPLLDLRALLRGRFST